MMNKCSTFLLIILLGILPSSCSINPATGHIDTVTMSKSHEVKLGEKLHKAFITKYPVYDDQKLHRYVNQVGKKLAAVSDRANIDYHFTVLDNPEINASALPGGYVYINRGLLAYLQDEAQLAAVLGHEIAHITARHSVRQQSAKTGKSIGAALTAILTGDINVANAATQWGDAALAGYGREMELEADKYGAVYMVRAGYDPQALIEVITLLKNHERFTKQLAKEKGIKKKSYHGLFATHPRNDRRLRQAVDDANETSSKENERITSASKNRFIQEYQKATENLIWGNNYDLARKIALSRGNRLVSEPLQFSIQFPNEWAINLHQFDGLSASSPSSTTDKQTKGNGWLATSESSQEKIAVIPLAIPQNIAPLAILKEGVKPLALQESEAIMTVQGLQGHTAIVSNDSSEKRIVVIRRGNSVFWIEGYHDDATPLPKKLNHSTLITAKSFQHLPPKSKQRRSKTIHYVTANTNTTFARLAKSLKLPSEGEAYLRLINGYYPRGEPYSGEVIKIIR